MALSKRERKKRQRRSQHNYHLRKNYGITIEDYDAILQAQKGKCAICRGGTSKNFFAVDHNHKNGKVRGLLCARCNTGLARFMDSATNVGRAYRYLRDDGQKITRILEQDSTASE